MSVSFVHITDHHLGASSTSLLRGYATAWALDRLLVGIGREAAHGADFMLSSGDLVAEGEDVEFRFACQMFGIEPQGGAPGPLQISRPPLEGLPLYLLPGNHDPRGAWARNLFPATPEAPHLDLRWTVDGVAFAYLDLGLQGLAGVLREESLALLDDVLADGMPTVVILHHHPIAVGIPWLDRALPQGVERLWQRLEKGPVAGVVFGHAHTSVECEIHGVPVLGLRSTCYQFAPTPEPEFMIRPLQYRLLTLAGERLQHQLFEVPLTGEARSRAVTDVA